MNSEEILVPIAMFAMIFGIIYISVTAKHRQRMAMIDKGMDPGNLNEKAIPFRDLRNGLFLVGIGLGLFFGYLMAQMMQSNDPNASTDNPLPYFIMVALFGGASLVAHHLIVRRKQQG